MGPEDENSDDTTGDVGVFGHEPIVLPLGLTKEEQEAQDRLCYLG